MLKFSPTEDPLFSSFSRVKPPVPGGGEAL
jgi:hypothetical protein